MVTSRMIYRDPVFSLGLFDYKKNPAPFLPFREKNTLLFGFGRVALYEGLKVLGIKKGESVLVPDYVCNVVIAPMHCLNIKVKFYEVGADLMPVWQSLEQKIDRSTKALLVVNYFGFPNALGPTRDLCDKRGIYLIEDNAHSFLSADNGRPLGSTGDISFFSFRKIAPVPNGAALVVNNQSLLERLSPPEYLKKGKKCLRSVARTLFYSMMEGYGAKEIDFDASRIKDACEEYNIEKYFIRFSRSSYQLLRHFNFNYIKEQRRKAYVQWLRLFSSAKKDDVKIVFPSLSIGVVPSCFPVLAENRKSFISKMWRNGIECFPWPFLPEGSGERYLIKRMVCLPTFPCSKIKSLADNG